MLRFISTLLVCLALPLTVQAKPEDYLKTNDYLDMAISPDGKTIASVAFDGEDYTTLFMDAETLEVKDVMKLRYPDTVGPFRWVSNDRIVMDVFRYFYNSDNYFTVGELFSVKVGDTKGKFIFGYRAGRQDLSTSKALSIAAKHRNMSRAWNKVIDLLEDDPKHILVAAKPWREDRAADTHIYRVNVEDGNIFPVSIFKHPYANIFTDGKGNIIGAWHIRNDFSVDVYRYQQKNDKWLPVSGLKNIQDFKFHSYEAAKGSMLFSARMNTDTAALMAYDLQSEALTTLYHNEKVDVDLVRTLNLDSLAYSIVQVDGQERQLAINPEQPLTQLHQAMVSGFKGFVVDIKSVDKSGQKVIFTLSNDRKEKAYYLFDAKKGKPTLIAQANKDLAGKNGAPMLPYEFAGDKGQVSGYITVPTSGESAPLVVMLHSFPQGSRYYWRYDPKVQMYVEQGYAVAQLNLPGADGYGKQRDDIGLAQWHPEQYTLLSEALADIGQKYAVTIDKTCISGRGWGAYMAVMAARYQPKTYRCVVAREGYYDFERYMDEYYLDSFLFSDAYMRSRFGGLDEEMASYDLKNHIASVTTPVMFAHAEYAGIQSLSSVEDLHEVLEDNNVNTVLHEIEKTTRNSQKFKEDVKTQKAIFKFLERHLN